MPLGQYLQSGELARLAGVSTDTLRHYERLKLLPIPQRSPGNYRLYPREALQRVHLIRHALAIGFSLPELSRILKVRDAGGAPCRQVKQLLDEKLSQLDAQISELLALREDLRTVLQDWDAQIARTPDGRQAILLETLIGRRAGPRPAQVAKRRLAPD